MINKNVCILEQLWHPLYVEYKKKCVKAHSSYSERPQGEQCQLFIVQADPSHQPWHLTCEWRSHLGLSSPSIHHETNEVPRCIDKSSHSRHLSWGLKPWSKDGLSFLFLEENNLIIKQNIKSQKPRTFIFSFLASREFLLFWLLENLCPLN